MRNCKHKHASLILDVTLHLQVKAIARSTKISIMIIQLNVYGGTGRYPYVAAPSVQITSF